MLDLCESLLADVVFRLLEVPSADDELLEVLYHLMPTVYLSLGMQKLSSE
jgi:hypothetical protein